MKFTRKAAASWQGTGKDGSGTVSTQSTVLDGTAYSYKTRFENGIGTNPEELVGAAHAACFTMQLAFLLGEEGYMPVSLDTGANVVFEDGRITMIELSLVGEVEGIDDTDFRRIAEKAKSICPISKLLNTNVSLSAQLS